MITVKDTQWKCGEFIFRQVDGREIFVVEKDIHGQRFQARVRNGNALQQAVLLKQIGEAGEGHHR